MCQTRFQCPTSVIEASYTWISSVGNMQPGHSASFDGVTGAGAASAAGAAIISAMAAVSHARAGAALVDGTRALVVDGVVMRISLPPDHMAGVMHRQNGAIYPR